MNPIEIATLVTSAVVLVVGVPLAVFHRAIAKELRHLRAHFHAHHKATHQKPSEHAAPRRKA
jgi:hypothetical protein